MKTESRNRARKGFQLPISPAALNPPTAATTALETPEPEPTSNPSEPTHSATHHHPPTTLLTLPSELRQLILQLSLPPSQLASMREPELEAHAAALGAIHPVILADIQFVAQKWRKERITAWATRGRYPFSYKIGGLNLLPAI